MKGKWINWTIVVLGLLLLMVPSTFDYSRPAAEFWNNMIIGVLITAFSLWEALFEESSSVSLLISVLGIWMIFAPYLLGYAQFASGRIIGLIVAVLAGYQGIQVPRHLMPHARH